MACIVFDIGNVLVRWDPLEAFAPELGSREAAEAFLLRIDFFTLNLRGDAGERFADMASEISDPEDRALFTRYPELYARTIREAIEGSFVLMERLRAKGHAIHAITNWSAETWPIGVATHPRLGTAFGVTVVSGQEGVIKPDATIFRILCDRAGVSPADCFFIDDSLVNVAGARASGWRAHHFTSPATLERALTEEGLL